MYTYKKIQEMRGIIFEEMKEVFGDRLTVEHWKLVEIRVQTAIMAGLFDNDIKKEVIDTRVVDEKDKKR
jgi:hypothetical protein